MRRLSGGFGFQSVRVVPGVKVASVVAGMVAGADSIDDLAVIRHGALPVLFGGIRAPFEASLLRRLQAAADRIHRLEHDNQQLRQALARALGEHRTAAILGRDTPNRESAKLVGPR